MTHFMEIVKVWQNRARYDKIGQRVMKWDKVWRNRAKYDEIEQNHQEEEEEEEGKQSNF